MATVRGIHGQSIPAATVLTDAYTVPASKNATVRVIATNTANSPTSFRVSAAPGGAADTPAHYIAYDVPLEANDTGSTITFMVDATDVVRVYSENGAIAFTVTGLEQDQ